MGNDIKYQLAPDMNKAVKRIVNDFLFVQKRENSVKTVGAGFAARFKAYKSTNYALNDRTNVGFKVYILITFTKIAFYAAIQYTMGR